MLGDIGALPFVLGTEKRVFQITEGLHLSEIIVSVVMPIRNEEKYIRRCLLSLLAQDYPQENSEWIFVDGESTDRTKEIIAEFQTAHPTLIRVLDNPRKIVPCAMNIGIEASRGKYIVRLDAHSEYANDYISKCVHYLATTDADNVGGIVQTKSRNRRGAAIAMMLSSRFGVGNSHFRTNGSSGYVDTVPYGAFRREVFRRCGGYDERLVRNQDNEINYRIRKSGGKVYLAHDIQSTYYCRDSLRGIADMAMRNGNWNVVTMKMCPGSMGVRHFVPLAFVLSLLGLTVLSCFFWLFRWMLCAELILYLSLDIFFSAKQAKSFSQWLRLLYLFPFFHISYGIGSLIGLGRWFRKEYRMPYTPKKI